ncbi:thioredoxin family protein [Pasteurella canis]|uniref:Protein Trx n=1 Tax=Pasteurella canis TaxID=753 RepID=A0A379EVR0_9PAST|nr:thioredoxin family protein [Pasteurella canis]UAY77102.1 thioredoxin family protein [Pasteurella canis]SUC10488.1 protein Trx [Pasteurella canis]
MKKLFVFLATLFMSIQILAVDFKPFEQASFDAALQTNKPVLVDVYADWCPTCKRQLSILEPMLQEEQFNDYSVFKVDYDQQKEVLKRFNVTRQSTLILFNEGKELRRGIAETNESRLRQFITVSE